MSDTFAGWLRLPRSNWQAVVTGAASEDEAWQRLRAHADQLGAKLIDLFVCPAEADPNRTRRTVR